MGESEVDLRRKSSIGCADWKIAGLRDDQHRLSRHAAHDPQDEQKEGDGISAAAAQKIVYDLVDVDE